MGDASVQPHRYQEIPMKRPSPSVPPCLVQPIAGLAAAAEYAPTPLVDGKSEWFVEHADFLAGLDDWMVPKPEAVRGKTFRKQCTTCPIVPRREIVVRFCLTRVTICHRDELGNLCIRLGKLTRSTIGRVSTCMGPAR